MNKMTSMTLKKKMIGNKSKEKKQTTSSAMTKKKTLITRDKRKMIYLQNMMRK
jgi:hypothetical protein